MIHLHQIQRRTKGRDDWETAYPGCGLSCAFSVPPGKWWSSIL